jgi:1-acyl-sn-glycerol-3-phosphate acyltransferase
VAALWLNVHFYVLFLLFSALYFAVLTPLTMGYGLFAGRRAYLRRIRRVISAYGTVIIHLLPFPFVRVRFEDREPGRRGACVVVCNHRSSSDPFLMAVLPWECTQVVNRWPFRLPILGRVARLAGYLSVNEMPFEAFRAKALAQLADGVSLIAFPEGTRSGGRHMGSFHGALFRVAMDARVPIVPLCISGNERMPPRGSLRLHPGTIRLCKLPAVEWAAYRDMTPFELKNHVRQRIADQLARMDSP